MLITKRKHIENQKTETVALIGLVVYKLIQYLKQRKNVTPPGIEPGTFRFLDRTLSN